MVRGRKPQPDAIRELKGKKPRKGKPAAKAKAPTCPAHLRKEAKAEYRRMIETLKPMKIITEADRPAIAAYAVAYARWVEAERELGKLGMIVKAPSGYPIQNPYLAISVAAAKEMMRILVEFGCTPSARARIQIPTGDKPPADQADPIGDILKFTG